MSKFLSKEITILGVLPEDTVVRKAVREQTPFSILYPQAEITKKLKKIVYTFTDLEDAIEATPKQTNFISRLKSLFQEGREIMDNKSKKKLLVVDDSAFMRKLISDFFVDSKSIEVVGIARNGKDAIGKIKTLQPDVLTMDVEMPVMNGLEALRRIMLETPVPVVMLSSTTKSGAESTMQAMDYGAVDFIAKPSGTISLDLHKVKVELVEKVEHAAQVSINKMQKRSSLPISNRISKSIELRNIPENANTVKWDKAKKKMVLIGTSTGGPRALQEVITKLPKNMKAPVLVVQHMPAGFTKSLAQRLNQLSEIEVKEAEDGDLLQDGHAYIAPGGFHMRIQKRVSAYYIVLDDKEPPRAGHRPAVDVLLKIIVSSMISTRLPLL